jgi:hypothetical protein
MKPVNTKKEHARLAAIAAKPKQRRAKVPYTSRGVGFPHKRVK